MMQENWSQGEHDLTGCKQLCEVSFPSAHVCTV